MPANVPILCLDAFPGISGDSLGLLHGCCTDARDSIRTRSGTIVVRPATRGQLMRASPHVKSANFALTAFQKVRHKCIVNSLRAAQ
jgi:hypothetical protein